MYMNPNREQPGDAFSSLDFAGFRSEFCVFYNEHHFVRCCWSNIEHYCWPFFVGPSTRKLYAKSNAICDGSLFPHFGEHVFRFVSEFLSNRRASRHSLTERYERLRFYSGVIQRVIRYPSIIITPMTTCNVCNVSDRILFTFAAECSYWCVCFRLRNANILHLS